MRHVLGREIVRCPVRLGLDRGSLAGTLRAIARIEGLTRRGGGVHVDLSETQHVSRGGGLLLTAQIERSRDRIEDCVNGYSPVAREPALVLSQLGFYSHLGFNLPQTLAGQSVVEDVARVCSGVGVTVDLSKRLESVASTGRGIFCDSGDFCDRIHEALNEAVTNILGHAYLRETTVKLPTSLEQDRSRLFKPPASSPGAPMPADQPKWWFSGHADLAAKELVLCALDFGATIPAVAPLSMSDTLNAFWRSNPSPSRGRRARRPDHEILEAVARAGREGYGTARRHQGFPNMIGLVEHDASKGSVRVVSGGGVYEFLKNGDGTKPIERSFGIPDAFPGTLIEWRISGPAGAAENE